VTRTSVEIIAPRALCYNGVCSDQQRGTASRLFDVQLVHIIPAIFATQKFVTVLTSAHYLSLTLTSRIHHTPPRSGSVNFHFNKAFPFTCGSPKYVISSVQRVRLKFLIHSSSLPFMLRAPSNLFPAVGRPNNVYLICTVKLFKMQFYLSSDLLSFLQLITLNTWQ
jgi:hypothetical protein